MTICKFSELFAGRDDAYGTYDISPNASHSDSGKLTGEAHTHHEPVTEELYEQHLNGERAIGIVPIRTDCKTKWFAIDVDTYTNESLHETLLKRVSSNGLPLIMTKSKSGGAHLWCFLTEPMMAKDARDVAKQYLKILRLPDTTEIFPKQIQVDKENVGNWINLPYFGDTRQCVTMDGEVDLNTFLKIATKARTSPADISHVYAEPEGLSVVVDGDSDAPPCIDTFEANGVPEGGRDNTMFHVAVYLRRKYPDDWENRVFEWNTEHCQPPLDPASISRINTQHSKTDFQYKCDDQPMCGVCDKDVCKTRKFGVGNISSDIPFHVNGLRKVDSEEPIYYLTINDFELRLRIDDLLDFYRMRKLYIKRANKGFPIIKKQTWDDFVVDYMNSGEMVVEEAPSIVGETGLTLDLLRQYISDFSQNEDMEQAITGSPYINDGKAYISSFDFIGFLERRVKNAKHELIWSVLSEEAGAKEEAFGDGEDKFRLWVLPWKGKARRGNEAF